MYLRLIWISAYGLHCGAFFVLYCGPLGDFKCFWCRSARDYRPWEFGSRARDPDANLHLAYRELQTFATRKVAGGFQTLKLVTVFDMRSHWIFCGHPVGGNAQSPRPYSFKPAIS